MSGTEGAMLCPSEEEERMRWSVVAIGVWMCGVAWAQDAEGDDGQIEVEGASSESAAVDDAVPEPPSPPEPAELFDAVVLRLRSGDYEGANLLIEQLGAMGLSDVESTELAYQRANLAALKLEYSVAKDQYEAIAQSPEHEHRRLDARFRAAELRGVLGDRVGAVEEMTEILETEVLDDSGLAKVALCRAIFMMEGERWKKGKRAFEAALGLPGTAAETYYQAKAWYTLTSSELDELDEVRLRKRKRRLRKALSTRIGGLQGADEALRITVELSEPEWILAGLMRLSASWERLGDDILAAPEPRLTDDQLILYRQGVNEQVVGFWLRGVRYLDGGINVVERLGYETPRLQEAREHRGRLGMKVEMAPTSGEAGAAGRP